MTTVLILMGVSGSGKTFIGQRLAASLDCPFFDGDRLPRGGTHRGTPEDSSTDKTSACRMAVASWGIGVICISS